MVTSTHQHPKGVCGKCLHDMPPCSTQYTHWIYCRLPKVALWCFVMCYDALWSLKVKLSRFDSATSMHLPPVEDAEQGRLQLSRISLLELPFLTRKRGILEPWNKTTSPLATSNHSLPQRDSATRRRWSYNARLCAWSNLPASASYKWYLTQWSPMITSYHWKKSWIV